MKMKKKLGVSAIVLVALFFGMFLVNGFCFTETPTLTDPQGDAIPQCDIVSVWIDNDNEYLRFKVEILGWFDATPDEYINTWNGIGIGINVDNETGSDTSEFWQDVDYILWFSTVETPECLYLEDQNNGSNDAIGHPEVSYFLLSNHNHTVEIGYKLKTYNNDGDGYLNISIRQTINVVFYAWYWILLAKGEEPPLKNGGYEDWCPYYPDFIIYTLTGRLLPLWVWIVIGVSVGGGVTALVLVLLRRGNYI